MKLLALPILLLLSAGVFAVDLFKYTLDYNELYVDKSTIVITNPNPYVLIDYQIRINITNITKIFGTQLIKILDEEGNAVNFCYEQPNGECNTTPSNIIWVKVPFIPANENTTLEVLPIGVNEAVDGDQVFDFYDDFNGDSLDMTKWNHYNGTIPSINNGILNITGQIYSKKEFDYPILVESSVKYPCNGEDADTGLAVEENEEKKWVVGWAYGAYVTGVLTVTYKDFPWGSTTGYEGHSLGWPDSLKCKFGMIQITFKPHTLLKFIVVKEGTTTSFTNKPATIKVGYDVGHAYQDNDITWTNWIRVRKYADQEVEINIINKKLIQGEWIVLDFSNITFVESDLSNIRVECENCEYYLVGKHKLLINNSATIYITTEKTYQKRTDVPGELLTLTPGFADLETIFEANTGTKLFSVPIGIEEWTSNNKPVIFFHVRSTTEIDVYSYDGHEVKKLTTINPSLNFIPEGPWYIKSLMNNNGTIVIVLRYTEYYDSRYWYGVLKYNTDSNNIELISQCVLYYYYHAPVYITDDDIYYQQDGYIYKAPITDPCSMSYVTYTHNVFQAVFYTKGTKGYGYWNDQIYELDYESFLSTALNIHVPNEYYYKGVSSVVYPYLTLKGYNIFDQKKISLGIKVYNLETYDLHASIDLIIDLSDKFNYIYGSTINPICSDRVCYIFTVINGETKDNWEKTVLILYELDLTTHMLRKINETEYYGGDVCNFISRFMKVGIYGITATDLAYRCTYGHFIGIYKITYFGVDAPLFNLDVLDLDVVDKVVVPGFKTNNKEIISGLKVSYITQNEELELLMKGNWKIYNTVKFYVKDYENLNTLRTYDLELGQVTSLTIDVENYPVTTKVFAFDKLTYILANETPSIQMLLPKLDIARILRIYVQPAGYWVYVLRKVGTKYELVDFKKSQPTVTGELNFFIPDTDYLRFEFYDAQGNLVYTYEDLITGNDYQFRLATNEDTDQEQVGGISYNLTTREKGLDVVEEAPETFNTSYMKWVFKEPVQDVEIYYLTNNTWYKMTIYDVNNNVVELSLDEYIDTDEVIRVHFVFVFKDNRTVWFTYETEEIVLGIEDIAERVRDDIVLQIIILQSIMFAYAVLVIKSKSEWFHIVSGVVLSIILSLLGVITWYYSLLICAALWLSGKGLIKWSI